MYKDKVVSTTVSEKQAIIRFICSQGEVAMVLNKKDKGTYLLPPSFRSKNA